MIFYFFSLLPFPNTQQSADKSRNLQMQCTLTFDISRRFRRWIYCELIDHLNNEFSSRIFFYFFFMYNVSSIYLASPFKHKNYFSPWFHLFDDRNKSNEEHYFTRIQTYWLHTSVVESKPAGSSMPGMKKNLQNSFLLVTLDILPPNFDVSLFGSPFTIRQLQTRILFGL